MNKTNGKSHSAARPELLTPVLSKLEQGALRKRDALLTQGKLELANADLQVAETEARLGEQKARRHELRAAVMAAGQRYHDDIRAMARAKGIDVERGVHFDAAKMTLSGEKG